MVLLIIYVERYIQSIHEPKCRKLAKFPICLANQPIIHSDDFRDSLFHPKGFIMA